jgi:hypothetical protein
MRTIAVTAVLAMTGCAPAWTYPAPPIATLTPLTEVTAVAAAQVDDYIVVTVDAVAPTPGYTDLSLRPVNYIQRPPDGMYDFTAVGKPPVGIAPQHTEPVHFTYRWHGVGADVKGVRVHAGNSEIEVKLTGR